MWAHTVTTALQHLLLRTPFQALGTADRRHNLSILRQPSLSYGVLGEPLHSIYIILIVPSGNLSPPGLSFVKSGLGYARTQEHPTLAQLGALWAGAHSSHLPQVRNLPAAREGWAQQTHLYPRVS